MSTRLYCLRMAARSEHIARGWDDEGQPHIAQLHQRTAGTWRAAGKAIPRRIGMVCARARRRYRKRMQYLGRCHRRGPMPERLRSKRLDAIFTCALVGHDPVNADDYTGNVFCSRCGSQNCDAIC